MGRECPRSPVSYSMVQLAFGASLPLSRELGSVLGGMCGCTGKVP